MRNLLLFFSRVCFFFSYIRFSFLQIGISLLTSGKNQLTSGKNQLTSGSGLFGNGLSSLCSIFGLIIDWRYRRSYNSSWGCYRIYRIVWKNAIEAWKCAGYSWSISGLNNGMYPIRSDGATLFSGKWQLTSHTVYRGIIASVMIGSYHVIFIFKDIYWPKLLYSFRFVDSLRK